MKVESDMYWLNEDQLAYDMNKCSTNNNNNYSNSHSNSNSNSNSHVENVANKAVQYFDAFQNVVTPVNLPFTSHNQSNSNNSFNSNNSNNNNRIYNNDANIRNTTNNDRSTNNTINTNNTNSCTSALYESFDAVTTYGIKLWKPETRQWYEVTIKGQLLALRTSGNKRGDIISSYTSTNTNSNGKNITNELTNGCIIDLCGSTLMFQNPMAMARQNHVS